MEKKFTSVFKINGFPIISPFLTAEKRDEIKKYRKSAVEIEKAIRDKKGNAISNASSDDIIDESIVLDSNANVILKDVDHILNFKTHTSTSFTENEQHVSEKKYTETDQLRQIEDSHEQKPRLIRSNSYTLDNPSPLLLKHIQNNEIQKNHNMSSVKLNFSSTINTKNKSRSPGKKSKHVLSSKKNDKKIKSPYGIYSPKLKKKQNLKETNQQQKSLDEIQLQQQKTKMEELLKQQNKEQKLLRDKFEKQKKDLLLLLKHDTQRTSTPINFECKNIERDEFFGDSTQSSILSQIFTDDLKTFATETVLCDNKIKNFGRSKEVNWKNTNLNKEKAASIINAHVRGYLVRRLMKTDKVQRVIQTIKDTLMFILDLHHEKVRKPSKNNADHQMKRTLLNQLTSTCYMLHDIFFSRTLQERLEIIQEDRDIAIDNLQRKQQSRSYM